jgi:hypothetical protein
MKEKKSLNLEIRSALFNLNVLVPCSLGVFVLPSTRGFLNFNQVLWAITDRMMSMGAIAFRGKVLTVLTC